MTYQEIAQTWVLFAVSSDDQQVSKLVAQFSSAGLTCYRIDEVIPVKGAIPTGLAAGLTMVRLEDTVPFSVDNSLAFHGVTQHLHYTTDSQRQELDSRSRTALDPSPDTRAVLIPISKSTAWWQQSQDRRQTHFQQQGERPGHTAIGIEYVDRVFRKLYHSRYLSPAVPYDFLTYFEFQHEHQEDFKMLLAELRDPALHTEWDYVELEYEIWMTKIG